MIRLTVGNRETPCQHCVSRRVPELCVPYTRGTSPTRAKEPVASEEERVKTERPGTASGGDSSKSVPKKQTAPVTVPRPGILPTLNVRVSRIEAMLNAVLNKVDGLEGKALNDWRISEYLVDTADIDHAPATTPPPSDVPLPKEAESPNSVRSDTERDRVINLEGDAQPGDVQGLDLDTSLRNPLPQSVRPLVTRLMYS